jgi:SAM-dependent methyltransferase
VKVEDLAAVSTPVTSILDAGCGTGINLRHLVDVTGASRGVGVEPSEQSVEQLRIDHAKDSRLSFETASIHSLPFASNSFDLVVCWSVLHWVGREEYLQALGELARVTSQWLVVMDFVAAEDYRVPYHHHDGLFTYKMDFEAPLAASGLVETVAAVQWWEPQATGDRVVLGPYDLRPFRERHVNYHSRKVCTFRKNLNVLQLLVEDDFQQEDPTATA